MTKLEKEGGQGWIGCAPAQTVCLTAVADSAVVRTQPCHNKKRSPMWRAFL
jgi:hypothetical protein